MSLSAANVLSEVRAILNESTAAFWSDAEINAWVTQAAIDLSTKLHCVETTATVTLSASTIEYAVPTTFANPVPSGDASLIWVKSAMFSDVSLTKILDNQFARITPDSTSDTPIHFVHFGERIFFFPVGSGASGSVDLLVAVETDDITDIPDEYQLLAILYAAGRGKFKDQKYAQGNSLMSEYTATVAFLRNDLIERESDSKEQNKIPDRVVAGAA
jgi:hypothetical protein